MIYYGKNLPSSGPKLTAVQCIDPQLKIHNLKIKKSDVNSDSRRVMSQEQSTLIF